MKIDGSGLPKAYKSPSILSGTSTSNVRVGPKKISTKYSLCIRVMVNAFAKIAWNSNLKSRPTASERLGLNLGKNLHNGLTAYVSAEIFVSLRLGIEGRPCGS